MLLMIGSEFVYFLYRNPIIVTLVVTLHRRPLLGVRKTLIPTSPQENADL